MNAHNTSTIQGKHGMGTVAIDVYTINGTTHLELVIDRPYERTYRKTWHTGFDGITLDRLTDKHSALVEKYVGAVSA